MSLFSSRTVELPAAVTRGARVVRFVRGLLWIGLALIAIWMAAAYGLPQHLRNTHPLYGIAVCISFIGRVLRFDLALAAGLIVLLALIMRRIGMAAAGAALSLILIWPTLASLLPKSPTPASGATIRVMSINLLAGNQNADAIMQQIHEADPDVIAMEEYTTWADDTLKTKLSDYAYRLLDPKPDSTGTALYSKVPMSAELQHPRNILGTRELIRATLAIDGHDVVLFAIHPSSPHYYTNILRNRLQTADLIDQLRTETLPVIVAGDFNATETTPNLQAYRDFGLLNTHDLADRGRGSTWPDITLLKYLPGFQIDHILIDPRLTCTKAAVCGPTGSDHRPVIADIGYSRNSVQSIR